MKTLGPTARLRRDRGLAEYLLLLAVVVVLVIGAMTSFAPHLRKFWGTAADALAGKSTPPTPTVPFRSDLAQHLKFRDLTVDRKNGIGGAHDLQEFMKAGGEIRIVETIPHPTVPGISLIRYQIRALDMAGNPQKPPAPEWKAKIYEKTVYDSNIVSDAQYLAWGRQAAEAAAAAGRLEREWVGTTPDGVTMRGYLDAMGAVRSFFPDFPVPPPQKPPSP